ncbi:hypothetical protein AB6A40_002531 [Gnathostoma spinigerum]|uniref:Phospholipid/glycerol acyltransferase domain-containing protein n=1 Tax=Gnathostoma spinigerum TaxID=75299 RepID=A0ABD6E929_9BILA
MGEPPRLRSTTTKDRVRGYIFCGLVLFSVILGSFYILTPCLIFMFLHEGIWKHLVDKVIGSWLLVPVSFIEYFYGTRVTVTGEKITPNEPALIIMNHRTCLDWLFFWNVLYQMDPWLLTTEKICLKKALKFLPGAGWAMCCAAFIFLERSFKNDVHHISEVIRYYANSGRKYQLLLFPEGTDKCPRSSEKSRLYAEKHGLRQYSYVLHPRTSGFVHIVSEMRKRNYIKYIYDVTVAYNDAIVQTEIEFFRDGACPKDVHCNIEKIPIEDVPESREELNNWLKKLWEKKEEQLDKFYNNLDSASRSLSKDSNSKAVQTTTCIRVLSLLVVTLWMLFTAEAVYIFLSHPSHILLGMFTASFFILTQYRYGGMEYFMIDLANKGKEAISPRLDSVSELSRSDSVLLSICEVCPSFTDMNIPCFSCRHGLNKLSAFFNL